MTASVAFLLRRHLHIHDDAIGAGGNLERRVLHVGGLFAEDGAEQALFGREFGLGFGRDLADQNIAGLYFGADADDAVGAEILERFVAEVRNVAGDFLGAELGVARGDFEFINVNAREDVFLHDFLADEDGVLEVVAVPRHESDEHVAAEGQLAVLRCRDRRQSPALSSRARPLCTSVF